MKKQTRLTAFLLTFVFLLPLLCVCAQLQTHAADSEKRFIFSELVSRDKTVYEASNDTCPVLPLISKQTTFEATGLALMGTNGTTNALYVSFETTADTNINGLAIIYTYTQNNSAITATEQRTWTEGSAKTSFVLHTPHISQGLQALSIQFLSNGTPTGAVTLLSLFDVSVYTGDESTAESSALATVKKCVYSAETNTVDITVQLSHEASVYYAGQNLELFALAPKEDPYLSNKTYVARAGVSLNDIHFSVPVSRVDEIYARYVIAAVNKEGMREPLCDPIYPDILTENTKKSHGFKGFHTSSLFSVIDSGADVEIVDVYLDRLENEQGILYAGAHSYYHFDQSYISELDRRVQNLTGVGCSVYLRFLISPEADEYSFVEGSAENIVHKGLVINSEEALLDIHAYTDFLVSRYTSRAKGEIAGIIIGRRADRASTYGYVGPRDLSEYAELYATALNLIAGTARNHIPDLQIVVPVSDRMWPETISEANLNGDYFSELFLVSLLEALKAQTMTPPEFCVMLESFELPGRVRKDAETGHYGVDGLSQFLAVMNEYSQYYSFLDSQILYSWSPDADLSDEMLSAAYMLQYVTLQASGRVRSFFVDFSLMEEAQQTNSTRALQYLATYIDTDQCDTVIAPVLQLLGMESVDQLIKDFHTDALKNTQVLRLSLKKDGYVGGKEPSGSYELWNFSEATGLLDWYVGNSCTDLSVLNRALTAQLSVTQSGEYADFAYHFPTAKNLSKAPLLRFSVGLDGKADIPYEIQIRILGKELTVISSVVVMHGDASELYLDLSEHAAKLTSISGIRVLARPLSGDTAPFSVRLKNVALESMTLSTEEIHALVSNDTIVSDTPGGEEEPKDYTTPILVTVLVIVVSVSTAAIVIIRHRRRKAPAERAIRTEAPTEKK